MLAECPQCREPVVEDQEKCPACGTPNRYYRSRSRPMLWVSVGLVLVIAVLNFLVPGLGTLAVLGIVTLGGLVVIFKAGIVKAILWVVGSVALFFAVNLLLSFVPLPVPPSLLYAVSAALFLNALERF